MTARGAGRAGAPPGEPPGEPPTGAGGAFAGVRALRNARERLRAAAARLDDVEVPAALGALVRAAWEAGFSRMTTCSMVHAALEEEAPKRGASSSAVRQRTAAWERQARELYDQLSGNSA
jgi:hypothetical protein